MKPLVRKALFLLLALTLSNGLASLTASAKEMRAPEKGVPAFAAVLPDDWTTELEAETKCLLMFNPRNTAHIVILVDVSNQTLEENANDAFAAATAPPYYRKVPAEISGCKGFTYFSTVKDAKGEIRLEMTFVQVDAKHVAARSLTLRPGLTKDEETILRLVANGLKLITE